MTRPERILAGLALMALIPVGCASGRPAPAKTPMVAVTAGLTYAFGLGDKACGVPVATACTGTDAGFLGTPALQVQLGTFAIDAHEVTNEQYRHCVGLGVCSRPSADGTAGVSAYYARTDPGGVAAPMERYADYPVVRVSWHQAAEYCAWAGKRLPTEFEWERVAGGAAKDAAGKRVLPWGDLGPRDALGDCDKEQVNLFGCTGREEPAAVKGSPGDRVLEDGEPIYDLFGNVHEWTASDGDPLATCDRDQTYTCHACVACLADTGNPNACKLACGAGQCQCGDAAAGGGCYRVCSRPLCARYRPSMLPLGVPAKGPAKAATRSVRGGSFQSGSGKDARRCEGRSDHRGMALPADQDHEAVGFRCAKTL